MTRIACAMLRLGIFVALCASSGARADDTSQGVMLPALEPTAPGSAVPGVASLSLGDKQGNRVVTLELQLTGTSPALSIHIPPFGWRGEAEPYPDRQFPELRVTLDGAPAHILSQPVVLFDGADITAQVGAARLDPFTITATPPFVDPVSGAEAAFAQLQKLGAITTDQDGNKLAQWSAGQDIKIPLGDAGARRLGLSYTARPGFAVVGTLDASFPLGKYCLTLDGLRHRLAMSARGDVAVETFAIPVGIAAKPPEELRVTLAPWIPAADPYFPGGANMLRAFCGADHQPVITGLEGVSHDAAAGSDGVAHILVIAPVLPAP